jgi:hypothetical protein
MWHTTVCLLHQAWVVFLTTFLIVLFKHPTDETATRAFYSAMF